MEEFHKKKLRARKTCYCKEMLGKFTVYSNSDDGAIEQQRTSKFTFVQLQELVGGRVGIMPYGTRLLVYDDEGLCKGLPTNMHFPDFVGTVVVMDKKLIK